MCTMLQVYIFPCFVEYYNFGTFKFKTIITIEAVNLFTNFNKNYLYECTYAFVFFFENVTWEIYFSKVCQYIKFSLPIFKTYSFSYFSVTQ